MQATLNRTGRCVLISLYALLLLSSHPGEVSPVKADHLRCEYLQDPLGIDVIAPRLSWEMNAALQAQSQYAYQVLVASDRRLLEQDKADLWNSGKVISPASAQIIYKGSPLNSRMQCYWKVRIWDQQHRISQWSPVAYWTMGLLRPEDWQAQWVGDKPDTTTIPYPAYLHSGFHSNFDSTNSNIKWVMIDLGSMRKIDEIRLYPAQPVGMQVKGYLFPVRFRIEISTQTAPQSFITVADHSREDIPNPGANVWRVKIPPVTARYIRIRVNKLARRTAQQYAFTLSQLEVLSHGKNLALHAPVQASDSIIQEADGWGNNRLTDGFTQTTQLPETKPSPPSPLLRKAFSIDAPVKRAILYVSALGLYEISINGQKAGDHVLAPEWTDYRRRVQYQTYDVTKLLNAGSNVIGAMLADGWYIGPLFPHPGRGVYGVNRRLIAQLEIEKEDGSRQVIATDSSWKIAPDGPVRSASIYGGEKYDERKAVKDWDTPRFDDRHWRNVITDTSIHITLSAQMNEPVKIIQELKPVRMISPRPGVYIFDLGQNMVGWCRLRITGYTGEQLRLRHGEILNEDSTLYTANLRGAPQIDSFIAAPAPEIVFEPRFTYHGFRYVEITGLRQRPDLSMLRGEVISSSMQQSGTFACSDTQLNQLWENILWTQRGNTIGVPTDCPQRDERMGWMGDAQVFSQTAIMNMDMAAFYTKWCRDIRDAQLPDGRLPDFAPQLAGAPGFYNAPAWADAAVVIPWRLYEAYGDKRILQEQYATLQQYIAFIRNKNPGLLWTVGRGNNYNDWLNGDKIIAKDYPRQGGEVPSEVFATAFFAHSTVLLARMAAILGKEQDTRYYTALADSIKAVFNKSFVSPDGIIKGNTQAGYALALHFDLLPDSLQAAAVWQMTAALARYDNRMSTGIQSTIRFMEELTRWGYNDLAYQLLESHRFPSWLYSVDQGATTIWERWDGYVKGRGFQDVGMNSLNHYAFGAVGQWMYRHIIGIQQDDTQPGYRHFIIHPRPGGGLQWARGTYHSIHGLISSNWTMQEGRFTLTVTVPVNTTATVYIPLQNADPAINNTNGVSFLGKAKGEATYLVQSGSYTFRNF